MAEQTYATHVHRPTAWSAAWLLSVIAVILLAIGAVRDLSLQTAGLLILAVAVALGITVMRLFALRLQDRIIRLEMQVRLTRLGRAGDLPRLSLPQLVALRFASDAELAPLLDRTLAEQLTPNQIKRSVTSWQGDYLRT